MFTCGWQALMLTLYKYLGNVQRNLYGLAALGLGLPLYDTKGQSPVPAFSRLNPLESGFAAWIGLPHIGPPRLREIG